ncbi:MAG TPA: hypothetical protein DCY93_00470 [Firmicutes bacterium]|nr:hypothetical protein [Bacillota bacterium]
MISNKIFKNKYSLKYHHKERVLLFDVLRGIGILGFLAFHFAYDLAMLPDYFENFLDLTLVDPNLYFLLEISNYCDKVVFLPMMRMIEQAFAIMFFVVSGISTIFSRNTLRNGIIVSLAAMFVTLFTYVLGILTGSGYGPLIRFGALHAIGIGLLIVGIIELIARKLKFKVHPSLYFYVGLTLVSIGILIMGICKIPISSDYSFIGYLKVVVGLETDLTDHFAIFPYSGYIVLGASFGNFFKHQIFLLKGRHKKMEKIFKPLTVLGRNSLVIYLFHQIVFLAFFILLLVPLGFEL